MVDARNDVLGGVFETGELNIEPVAVLGWSIQDSKVINSASPLTRPVPAADPCRRAYRQFDFLR